MNSHLAKSLISSQLRHNGHVKITVEGVSMNPVFFENDIITIKQQEQYEIGDILVYDHCSSILVHRVLEIKDNLFYCKGDNALGHEIINYSNIVGKVYELSRAQKSLKIPPFNPKLIFLSNAVTEEYEKNYYDILKTKSSYIHILYDKIISNMILKKEDDIMIYRKNETMDFIKSDETSLAVFDPGSGNTYFLNEAGADILQAIESPCETDEIIKRLCKIYEASPEEIRPDIEDFLTDMLEKKVVEIF